MSTSTCGLENTCPITSPHVAFVADAGHHQARRHRDDQRRQLGHQAVTDGQQGVGWCAAPLHVVLDDADEQPADTLMPQDEDAATASPRTNLEAPSIAP